MNKILIYGYGNPGRKDDGLGVQFAEEMEKWAEKQTVGDIDCDMSYQLSPEDAVVIAPYDVVLFADASLEDIEDFSIGEILPDSKTEFSLHSISPGYVAHLCKMIYGRTPLLYLVHIRGYEWQLELGISKDAAQNLAKALTYTQKWVRQFLSEKSTFGTEVNF